MNKAINTEKIATKKPNKEMAPKIDIAAKEIKKIEKAIKVEPKKVDEAPKEEKKTEITTKRKGDETKLGEYSDTSTACIYKNWDNYCNWPNGASSWKRSACGGDHCQVSTWGSIYSYPLRHNTPNLDDIVPRFHFRRNWVSLYRKLIIVSLNVHNGFNLKKRIFVREQSELINKLEEIETFLKSGCAIWHHINPTCNLPDSITAFPFQNIDDFSEDAKYIEYQRFLDDFLKGHYLDIPICSN